MTDKLNWTELDCSLSGFSQTGIMELIAISFFRGSSWPRDWTWVSHLAGGFFTIKPPKKVQCLVKQLNLARLLLQERHYLFSKALHSLPTHILVNWGGKKDNNKLYWKFVQKCTAPWKILSVLLIEFNQITAQIHTGEGNGNPLQSPYVENHMDRGAWRAAVHGITKSRAQLSD